MKTYVITLSKKFPKGHKKEGKPTFFKEQLQNALLADAGVSACDCCKYETRNCRACGHEATKFHEKLHTIRANYDLWAKRFEEVERGEACISVRQWTDKPYRSTQIEIAQLTREYGIGLQKLDVIKASEAGYIDYKLLNPKKNKRVTYEELAANDGLTLEDFREWFKDYDTAKPMAIIQFTGFRYNL